MLYPDIHELMSFKGRKRRGIPKSLVAKSFASGNHLTPFPGRGLEFDTVREYVPQDDIRNIDWKVTARAGAPHIKLYKEAREYPLHIALDMNRCMRFGTKNTFKSIQAARSLAFLGWEAIKNHDRISVSLFGDVSCGFQYFPPNRSHSFFSAVLKKITALPKRDNPILLEEALPLIDRSLSYGSDVYIISDFMSISSQLKENKSLKRLRKKCNIVFITINDPVDRSLFPLGMLGFREGEERITIDTENAFGRQAYEKSWEENRIRLKEISKRLIIPLVELTTESKIEKDLLLGLKRCVKRKRL